MNNIELSEQNLMQFLFHVPAAMNDTIVHLNQRGVGTGRSQHLQDEHVRLGCLEILLRFGLVPSLARNLAKGFDDCDPNMVDVAMQEWTGSDSGGNDSHLLADMR